MFYSNRKKMEFNLINKKNLWRRLMNNYLQMICLRRARLKTLGISLGYDCQCSCIHCSAGKLINKARSRLSLDDLIRTIDESIRLGVIHFNITGGEPLLYTECFDLLAYISAHKSSILSLATNGILLDLNTTAKLKKVGLDVVQISLDSDNEEIHDRERGFRGVYRKALEGINNARKSGLIVFISAVFTNENLLNGEIIRLASIAKESDAILHLNSACSAGRWGEKYFYLNNEAREKLGFLLKMPHVRINTEAAYFSMGCKAGSEKIYITAYGDVLPCPFIQLSFGNIKKNSLEQIWKEMRALPYLNGSYKECLTSQNREFISKYIEPLSKTGQMPYPYELIKRRAKI